jgi:hypothetical protein
VDAKGDLQKDVSLTSMVWRVPRRSESNANAYMIEHEQLRAEMIEIWYE